MDFRIATQIFIVIVTIRVSKSIEDGKDINLKNPSGPDINTHPYVNQDYNLVLDSDMSDKSVYTAGPNISAPVHTINNTTKSESNNQLQPQWSSSTTSNKTNMKQGHKNSIKEGEVNTKETDCTSKNGYCKNNAAEAKAKTKRHNFKNRDRKHGEKWNPPRRYIGPEKKPTDNTIDVSKIDIGPEVQYNLECDLISRNSRFNPYSMLNEKLFAFYVWGPVDTEKTIEFTVPSTRVFNQIKKKVDAHLEIGVDWEKRHFMMIDQRNNYSAVLVEHNDSGRFCLYPYIKMGLGPPLSHDLHVQFKQSADGKYLLMIICNTMAASAYLFSRYKDIPSRKKIPDVIAMLGVSGHGGKSYLYQGHEWFPVEEMDELEYWALEYGRNRPEAIPEKRGLPYNEIEEFDDTEPDDKIPNFVPFKLDL